MASQAYRTLLAAFAAPAIFFAAVPPASASRFTVLYSFTNADEGGTTPGPVVVGQDGGIYGAAYAGGAAGLGQVFRVDPSGTLTVLHQFSGPDGQNPAGTPVLRDHTLFGTANGGPNQAGVIYAIGTDGSDYRILYQGYAGALIADKHKTLYGIGPGATLFRLTPEGVYTVLQTFSAGSYDGISSLAIDGDANLYGVNEYLDQGTDTYRCDVFEYAAGASAATTIYSFTGTPSAGCSVNVGGVDNAGVVYGYTEQRLGKKGLTGTIFSLAPMAGGYVYALLHSFTHSQTIPTSLAVSFKGVLTGTSISYLGRNFLKHTGELFRIAAGQYSALHVFPFYVYQGGNETGGSYPRNVPFVLPTGEIVGSTATGGATAYSKTTCDARSPYYQGCGTIYTYVP